MKKLLASVLVLALVLSLSVSIFAADEIKKTDNNEASVEYENGGGGTIVEPGDPDPDPEPGPGPDPDSWANYDITKGLYFGKQTITSSNEKYDSQYFNGTDGAGKTVGFITENNHTEQAFRVDVSIGEFHYDLTNPATKTMAGALVTLNFNKMTHNVGNSSTAPAVANQLTLNNAGQEIYNAGIGEAMGYWAANWTGELAVLGGTVSKADTAQAVMTWQVVHYA